MTTTECVQHKVPLGGPECGPECNRMTAYHLRWAKAEQQPIVAGRLPSDPITVPTDDERRESLDADLAAESYVNSLYAAVPPAAVPYTRQHRRWNTSGVEIIVLGRVYEGKHAGKFRTKEVLTGLEGIYSMAALSTMTHETRTAEPPAPYDDEHQHGDPMAATLSDRTRDKVLSRPAHVPSLVMLDRDAAAQHLADVVAHELFEINRNSPDAAQRLTQALADYRETTR